MITNFTPEQRQKAQENLAESRRSGMEKYIQDFRDEETWIELAAETGYRLPAGWQAPDTAIMTRWLRRLKITRKEYLAAAGYERLEDFASQNSNWSARAWCGLLLEYAAERDQLALVLRTEGR